MSQKNNLTAWERWELASLEGEGQPSPRPPIHAWSPPKVEAPTVVETTVPLEEVQIPTAEEIEQIHQQAHDTGHKEGYEAGLEAGRTEGYQAGYNEGRAKGDEEGRRAGEEAAQHLTTIAGKLDAALADLDGEVAEELTALALEVAREVLRQSLLLHPETVVGVVRDALTQLPHQHANIYLHPDDAALVRSYAGDQLSHAGHRIHEDARLQRNDVSLEASGAHVDATLATRWRRVVETLGSQVPWDGKPLPPEDIAPAPTTTPTETAPAEPEVSAEEAPADVTAPPTAGAMDSADGADTVDAGESTEEAAAEDFPAEEESTTDSIGDESLPVDAEEASVTSEEPAVPAPEPEDFSADDPIAHLTDDTPLPGVDPTENLPPEEQS